MEVIYEDNHIIIVSKTSSEIVQGDKTGDTPLSETVKQYLKDNPEFCEQIAKEVMAQKDRLLATNKATKKKEKDEEPAAVQEPVEETPVPQEAVIADMEDDFGAPKSSASKLIDIEADDK